jgi:hypothetical protein
MARTTPAQKPRGEHNMTLSDGLAVAEEADREFMFHPRQQGRYRALKELGRRSMRQLAWKWPGGASVSSLHRGQVFMDSGR